MNNVIFTEKADKYQVLDDQLNVTDNDKMAKKSRQDVPGEILVKTKIKLS